jgi:hypothetical protein
LRPQYELRYVSDKVKADVAVRIAENLFDQTFEVTSYLATWNRVRDRVLFAYLAEILILEKFISNVTLRGNMLKILISSSRSQKGLSVSQLKDSEVEVMNKKNRVCQRFGIRRNRSDNGTCIWKEEVFCGVMKAKAGPPQPREKDEDLCYLPLSSKQKLYDAVIVPHAPSEPITVLQITVGGSHSVALEEFMKLRLLFPDEEKFKFLMLRVAVNLDDAKRMVSDNLDWIVGNHGENRMTVKGINDLVDFYECILNFEETLLAYRKGEFEKK